MVVVNGYDYSPMVIPGHSVMAMHLWPWTNSYLLIVICWCLFSTGYLLMVIHLWLFTNGYPLRVINKW